MWDFFPGHYLAIKEDSFIYHNFTFRDTLAYHLSPTGTMIAFDNRYQFFGEKFIIHECTPDKLTLELRQRIPDPFRFWERIELQRVEE